MNETMDYLKTSFKNQLVKLQNRKFKPKKPLIKKSMFKNRY